MPLKTSIFGSAGSIFLAGFIALLSSENGYTVMGIPSLIFCAIYSFGIHWIFFIHAYSYQTEHYFDATGSFTYISLSLILIINSINNYSDNGLNIYSLIIGSMVIIWAMRLGSFLFKRVKEVGQDIRFIEMKKDFFWFLMTWTLSGLWVFLTYAAGLLAMTSVSIENSFSHYHYFCLILGSLFWVIGFLIEVISDHQKKVFRRNESNKGKFIKTGLWAWSRHPNYFGNILLWFGIFVFCYGYDVPLWTIIGPLWTTFLLLFVSGIPLLEASADKKYGDDPEYLQYKSNTSVLVPWFNPSK